jgi:hypothetical protein
MSSIEIVEDNFGVVEVLDAGPRGLTGDQGDPYEFVGGLEGQVWTALAGSEYGWNTPIANIVTGVGLDSQRVGDAVEITLTGQTSVVEVDVSQVTALTDTVAISSEYAGKVISITQTSGSAIPLQFMFDSHDSFTTGQQFEIRKSEEYINQYFVVHYTNSVGTPKVLYPSYSCSLLRTDSGWVIETDGMLNRVDIVSESNVALYSDSEAAKGVQATVYADHPAVEFIETHSGVQVLSVDLNKEAERTVVFFKDVAALTVGYRQAFVHRVYVLNSEDIQGHSITLTTSGVPETYNNVGLFKVNQHNVWSDDSDRMAFKGEVSGKYVAFDDTNNSWVVLQSGQLVNGQHVTGTRVVLMSSGVLPSSHGNILIDSEIESIPSEHFGECTPIEKYDTDTKTILISFAGTVQFGFVVL